MARYMDKDSKWFCYEGADELLVTSPATHSIPAPTRLGNTLNDDPEADDADTQHYLIYGWPTLVYPGARSYVSVAPLFVVEAEPDRDDNGSWQIAAKTEPEINPSLAALGYFDRAIVDEVMDSHAEGLPFGDPRSMVLVAESVAERLGVEFRTAPDPSSLDTRLRAEPGLHNSAVVIRAAPQYLGDTIRELRELRKRDDWQQTAARLLIPSGTPSSSTPSVGTDEQAGTVISAMPSNQSQDEALRSLVQDPLTVITGPPGTGKTQLVVNAAANLAVRRESILITSVNNAAVDVAAERAAEAVCQGLIIRTGNRGIRETVSDQVEKAAHWSQQSKPVDEAEARSSYETHAAERERFLEQLDGLERLDRELLPLAESVSRARLRSSELSHTLWGGPPPEGTPEVSLTYARAARRLSRAVYFRVKHAEKRLLARFRLPEDSPLSPLADYFEWVIKMRAAARRLRRSQARRTSMGDIAARVTQLDHRVQEAGKHLAVTALAGDLRKVRGRIPQSPPARRRAFRRYVAQVLNLIRGWACTSLAVSASFPLKPGLFDLVVIDEASQCTLATVLPVIYRAKRIAVCGDPRQLQPIVKISKKRLETIADEAGYHPQEIRKRGLDHGASAYRAFEAVYESYDKAPILLREHYRSHPTIARWFNKTFYDDQLIVLTDPVEGPTHGALWKDVNGIAQRGRSRSWVNEAEAMAVANYLQTVLGTPNPPTIGVITPFRGQADHIRDLVGQIPGSAKNASRFVVGTAHALQGNERELIVFSSVVAPGISDHAQQWVEKERHLINVAVSRARDRLVVIGHPHVADLGNPTLASLRRGHLDHATLSVRAEPSEADYGRFDSSAERLLYEAGHQAGLVLIPKRNIGGYELDFAVETDTLKLNIEVDGEQHLDSRQRLRRQDVARDRMLHKRGWTIRRIPAWRCHADPDAEVGEIINLVAGDASTEQASPAPFRSLELAARLSVAKDG